MFVAGVGQAAAVGWEARARRLAAYVELSKPRVTALVVAVAAAGFRLGAGGTPAGARLVVTLVAVALLGAGIFSLNQCFESAWDARMRRTAHRPLPSGRIQASHALWFGWLLSAAGLACLAAAVNWLSAAIGAATLASYLFLYTPLKRTTPHCTAVGAFPGAAPPLLGWAAAAGTLPAEAWWLFGILLLWQFPHFHSIALLYRDDYARAGFRLWTVVEADAVTARRQTAGFAALLLPVSLAPAVVGGAGLEYLFGAALLGAAFLLLALRTARSGSRRDAQRLLLGSVVYLPALLLLLMIFDR